jgi:hypothetical protein
MPVLSLQLLHCALQVRNLESAFFKLLIFGSQGGIGSGSVILDLLLQGSVGCPKTFGFVCACLGRLGLFVEEFPVLGLLLGQPGLQLLEIPLVVAVHLLDPEVQFLDLLVLVLDLVFEVALFEHDAAEGDVVALEFGAVLDVPDGGLRAHVLVVLFGQHQQVVELLVLAVVFHIHLVEPVLVVLSHQQLLLNFLDQSVLCLGQCLLQLRIFIAQLLQLVREQVAQGFDIGLVQTAHLDLQKLNLPLVVQDHFLQFLTDLVVQLFYSLDAALVGLLQQLALTHNRFDFFLLALDYAP